MKIDFPRAITFRLSTFQTRPSIAVRAFVNVPVQIFEGTRSAFVPRNSRLDFQAALAILFIAGLMPASLHGQSAASVSGHGHGPVGSCGSWCARHASKHRHKRRASDSNERFGQLFNQRQRCQCKWFKMKFHATGALSFTREAPQLAVSCSTGNQHRRQSFKPC